MILRYIRLIPVTACLFLTFAAGSASAQGDWTGTLSINPYPSPYLSDWESNPTIGQAEITNNTSDAVQAKIFLTIERNGNGIIASGNSVLFDFPPGSAQNIPLSDLVDYGSLQYNRDLENTALRTGRLPAGEYQACIRLDDAAGNRLLDNVCTSFTIIYPDPPYLTFPFDGDTISTEYPVFQWTPVQVPPGYPFHYSLLIVEMLSGQLPSQALAANIPQYEDNDIGTSSLQYPIDALPLDDSATYAWQVQALDDNGYPVSSNDGKSEIWTFVYSTGMIAGGGQPPPAPAPTGEIAINITHIGEAQGIFQNLYNAPFDSILAVLNSMANNGALNIPIPIPNLESFPDISIPHGFLQISDSLFTIGGQSDVDNRQTNIQYEGRRGADGRSNNYSFDINIPNNINFSDFIGLAQPYFPSLGILPIDFNLSAPSLKLNMSGGNVGLGIDGHFDIGQLSGLSDINIQFIEGRPSFNFSLGDLPDNVDIADLTAAVESLLTDWRPATGPATDWINSFDLDLNDLNLGLDFVPNQTTVDISGAFDTGNLRGRAGFRYLKEDRESSVSGYLNIDLNNIDLQDVLSMADSLFPNTWSPPSGPAVNWIESLGLNFPQATLSLSFGDDQFGIGISGSFVTNQRSGTASLAFSQTGQQTSLSFKGAFDNDVSFTLNDAFALLPNVQPVPFNMPWLESLTLGGPSVNVRITPDSLIAGVSGNFTSGQRSGTAELVYTSAGDNPVIKATVRFNQDASFALSDMVALLPSSWPAPSGEVFDWLGNLGLNIPGITMEMTLKSDCVNVSMFGPFALAGQPGSARVSFDYCGEGLVVSGGIQINTQEIAFTDALALADSLLPSWTPPSGPVFDKIESLGFSFPSMTLDLSFRIDSLQVGLLGPFRFGGGGNEREGNSDIKLVRSNGQSSLLGGFNFNLSDIDLPAILNTITGLLPDGWTLPSGPAIDRLQSLNLNFLRGSSLGMNFNPSGFIDFDLFGPFHFNGGGGGGQGGSEGQSNVGLVQDDNGYRLGGSLDFNLPQIDLPGVMDLISNILPSGWTPSSIPSMDWLQSFDFSFDHPSLNIAFPQNGFNIIFDGPFHSGQANGSRSGSSHFAYLYTGGQNRFSGVLDFNIENIQFGGLLSLADSLFGGRWSAPSGPAMDLLQSMDFSFPNVDLALGFNPDSISAGIAGSFAVGDQQGSANLTLVRSNGENSIGGDISLLLHNVDYPRIMALADSLLPDSWNPPSGPAARAIESLDLNFPEASLTLSFASDNFNIGVAGTFVMGQRHGTASMEFATDNLGSSVRFSGSFGADEMFNLADLTSMFSPGQMSRQLDWLQSIRISGPTLGIYADADSVRASINGSFILNQRPGTAELAITSTSQMGSIAFTGAFNSGVTYSFGDILQLLPGDMSSLTPPVDINLSAPGISILITNESFRAGISGGLNIARQSGSASLTFSYDNGNPTLVFTGTVNHFSSDDMISFIQNQTGVSNFADNLPQDLLEFNDLTITIGVGADNRFSIAANSNFMGQRTDLLVSVIRRSGHPPIPVIGIRPAHWSLSEAFPELSSPIIDELNLSTLGFVFSSSSDTLESSELSPEERQFYGGIRGSDNFSLKLNSGVMLMGTILPSSFNPDGPMNKILNLLGGGDQGLYLEGSLPLGFGHGGGGLDGLSLSLSLPPMSPPNPPDWFQSGLLSVVITGNPIGVSLVGSVTTDIDEQVLTFFVAGAITLQGPNVSFTISGGLSTDEPWEQPFGIPWLIFNRAIIMVGVNATGNISLGFRADMVVGEKDMDVAVLVSVNASGVPTNFMLDGQSDAGFGLSDLVELQHGMAIARAQAEGQPAPPMLPLETLPPMDIKNVHLKFAPHDEPALDITRGMAIVGELYTAFQPGQEPQDFAGVDIEVEDMRIHASGHLAAFALGPITWDDGLFDMNLEIGNTHLIIDGQAQFLENSQQVTVNMSRDSLYLHTSTQLDNRFSTDLVGKGILNLQNPSMQVRGTMQSDFNGQFAQLLSDGIADFANSSNQAISAALDAYNQVSALHEHKQQAIDSLTTLLNNVRAAAQNGMNQAQAERDQARAEKSTALSQKNNAYNAWQNTPRTEVTLRAQRYTNYVTKAGIYAAKAAVYATRQAVFLAKQAAYNNIPSPDTDPVLVGLREQSDQLWAEMQNRMTNLQNLQTFVQGIIDYMNQQSGPLVTVQGAQFDASLTDLTQGTEVQLGVDMTMAGESRHIVININLRDEASAIPGIISSLTGTIG